MYVFARDFGLFRPHSLHGSRRLFRAGRDRSCELGTLPYMFPATLFLPRDRAAGREVTGGLQ